MLCRVKQKARGAKVWGGNSGIFGLKRERGGRVSGFTMIELSLSLTFIALLSVIIVLIITDAVSAYHRGITLNQINSVGTELVDDIRAAIEEAPGREVVDECDTLYTEANTQKRCEEDSGKSFTEVERYGDVTVGSDTISVPLYGIYCTGSYSYLWNSGYFFNEEYEVEDNLKDKEASLTYTVFAEGGGTEEKTIYDAKLLKINDPDRMLCKLTAGYDPDEKDGGDYNKSTEVKLSTDTAPLSNEFDITATVIDDEPVDILAGSTNLAVYDLTAAVPAKSESAAGIFHSVSMILGTLQGGINISVSGNYCATPEGYNAAVENFDYCAINKFNFAARAMGD